MKKILMIPLFLLTAIAPVHAQRLAVTESTVDCGKTAYELPITATFELRNKGSRKLVINEVKTDCGCTIVDYPKESIGGGERFLVKVTYDARQLGHFQKQVGLYTNGSKKPVYLVMKGVVLEDYVDYSMSYPYAVGNLLLDKRDLEFDDVNKGDRPTQEIHIMNNGTKEFHPNVMHLPSYLSATVTPERIAPGHPGVITFTLNSDHVRDYGLTQTSVYIARQPGEKVSTDNEIGVTTVLLPSILDESAANYAPRVILSSESLDIDFAGKDKVKGEIEIRNAGTVSLNISALQMFTTGLRVTLGKRAIAPGQTTKLKVTAFRDQLSTVRTQPRIFMITNDPSHAKVIININVK